MTDCVVLSHTLNPGGTRAVTETLSELICRVRGTELDLGTLSGTCCICGKPTEHGHKFDTTGTFTTYQYILGGDCICPYCWEMKRNRSQDYRSTMWVVSPAGFRAFKFDEAREVLQNPPEPPFAMYFTRTWKRQGWTRLVTRINYSRDRYIAGFDYDLIDVDATVRDQYFAEIDTLFARGVSKTEMATGDLKPRTFESIGMDPAVIDLLQQRCGDPLWDLCLFVTRAPTKPTKPGKPGKPEPGKLKPKTEVQTTL